MRKSRIPSLNRSKTLLNIKVDSTGKGTNKPEYENVVLFRNSKSSEKLEEIAQTEPQDELIPLPKFKKRPDNLFFVGIVKMGQGSKSTIFVQTS